MKIDDYGQHIYKEQELLNALLQTEVNKAHKAQFLVTDIDDMYIKNTNELLDYTALVNYIESTETIQEFDKKKQAQYMMPKYYKDFNIAEHILDLCNNDEELQRCGEELLLYLEKDLFELLIYLKYLVDILERNNIIWGVGRGSSVASFVLYKLKIHKVNSIKYKLNINEFFRNN